MSLTVQERGAAPEPYAELQRLPIAGQWREGRDDGVNRDRNPFTGETLLEIPQASREDLDRAYEVAARTQREWAARLPGERAEVMRRAARIMEARRDEVISWIIQESGSTRIKATLEWEAVHGVIQEAASLPYLVQGSILPADVPGKEGRVYRKPVGVVGVISPWNWPLQLTARSLFPALVVGNAVVVKPASDTPVTGGLLLARILEEAGLPPGVLSVVVGAGSEIGDELFGPIAPIIRARDEADALRLANDTEYGLSSCVFTGDLERGARFAQELQAGMAHVNDQPVNDLPHNPFGGEKNSGIGRFNGRWAVDAFTTEQW